VNKINKSFDGFHYNHSNNITYLDFCRNRVTHFYGAPPLFPYRTKGASARLSAYGLLEKANAFSSCDAYAAEAFLVERFD
jgi:hypothetical protein